MRFNLFFVNLELFECFVGQYESELVRNNLHVLLAVFNHVFVITVVESVHQVADDRAYQILVIAAIIRGEGPKDVLDHIHEFLFCRVFNIYVVDSCLEEPFHSIFHLGRDNVGRFLLNHAVTHVHVLPYPGFVHSYLGSDEVRVLLAH